MKTTAPPFSESELQQESPPSAEHSASPPLSSDSEGALPPTDGEMPPVESLDENADISGFMSPRVGESLRRRALRKIFLSAKFNVRDGLDDYDDDFTSFAPLGDVITAEMRRLRERLQKADAESESADSQNNDAADSKAPSDSPSESDSQSAAESDSALKAKTESEPPSLAARNDSKTPADSNDCCKTDGGAEGKERR